MIPSEQKISDTVQRAISGKTIKVVESIGQVDSENRYGGEFQLEAGNNITIVENSKKNGWKIQSTGEPGAVGPTGPTGPTGAVEGHGDLPDMPDVGGTNSDHDARYYTESEIDTFLGNYVKRDGTTELTADWDAGAFTITALTFTSDVAIGTAPFTVTSTTLVSNLNADQVDGYNAADMDYDFVSGNDADTDVTGAELETLSDGSDAGDLHIHDSDYYTETEIGATGAISGASLVGVYDTDGYWTGTTVEAILAEIGAASYLNATAADALYHRLDSTNTPFTGPVEIDVTDASYAFIIDNDESRSGAGILVALGNRSTGYYLNCYNGTGNIFYIDNSSVVSTLAYSGTSGSFSSTVYSVSFRSSDGTATAPGHSFNNDTNTGMYRVSTDRLGFTTAGKKCAEFTAAGDLQLVKKLAINYTGTIDSGVQIHLAGDASNNANIRMDGYKAGFFYFGYNDTYTKAALSVSDGTTTTWDALNIDENGLVQIGDAVATSPTGRLNVTENHASRPTLFIKQSGAGDIAQFLDGGTEVISIEDDGKMTHTATAAGSRSIMTLNPVGNAGLNNLIQYDSSLYNYVVTSGDWITYAIEDLQQKGGIVKIRKITVRGYTYDNSSYINNTQIAKTPSGGVQTNIWSSTTDYGNGSSGEADWVVYNSTGITLTTDPIHIAFQTQQTASGRVRIRGVIIEYDLV